MDITQKDRDALRRAQQRKAQQFVIGNLVEHKIQDPIKYKQLSRIEQGLNPEQRLEPSRIRYESQYLTNAKDSNSSVDCEKDKDNGNDSLISPVKRTQDEEGLPITSDNLRANPWLNMDCFEFDKLEWMSDKADKLYQEKIQTSTHFDSEGRAIPPSQLQSHIKRGESPNEIDHKEKKAPSDGQVHEIGELVNLLDSQFQPQVTYALNVISKIASRATTGYYDGVFDKNVHEILLKECLLRVRHHIDSCNETICQTSLRCLRSLLCNLQIDEIFLDRMHPILTQDVLETIWLNDEGVSEKFDIDVNDVQCVEMDSILALVIRTNLISRLTYLVRTKQHKFADGYNECILDILIRLARHSRGVCLLMGDAGLLSVIIEKFLPIDVVRCKTFDQLIAMKALKFVRIMALANRDLCVDQKGPNFIKIPQEIMTPLESYYYLEFTSLQANDNGIMMKLHIEALRLLKILLLSKEFSNQVYSTVSLSLGQLIKHFQIISKLNSVQIVESRISLDWQFAAHMIDLIGYLGYHEVYQLPNSKVINLWTSYVVPIVSHWLTDIIREKYTPHLDVSITISVAILHFWRVQKHVDPQAIVKVLFNSINTLKDGKENASLQYFNFLVREMERKSQLKDLLERDGRIRDPKMLNSYGCLNFNPEPVYSYSLNATIDNDSPMVLLDTLVSILYTNQLTLKEYVASYTDNLNVVRYLRCATSYHDKPINYEAFAQNSLLVQREVSIMNRLIMLQASHYFERRRQDVSSKRLDPEPDEIRSSKRESYANFIFSAISIVGLVSPRADQLVCLKDKLMETVILNHDLHTRLARDIYRNTPSKDQMDLKYYAMYGLDIYGERTQPLLSEEDTFILHAIYKGVEQPGRLWIFQPIIEYYNCQIRDRPQNMQKVDMWFSKGLQIANTDQEVFASILKLHAAVIHTSPNFHQIMVRPNMEEFLCLLGLVFLDDDLFLDERVSKALGLNLEILVAECLEKQVVFSDASKIIQPLGLPLFDIFNLFLDQYEACSYGQSVFTNYILLFMNPLSDRSFKRKLFLEKMDTCIGQMRLPTSEVWPSSLQLFDTQRADKETLDMMIRCGDLIKPGSFLFDYRRKQLKRLSLDS